MFNWFKNIWASQFRSHRSNFASVASHELRTPLSIVKWYTEILLDEDMGPLNEDQKKYLRVIESSNERAISLVTSLLNVSRLELGTFSVSPEPLLFTDVLEEVLKKQEKRIEDKKLTLSKKITGDVYSIQLDKGITTLIIRSILENAVMFSGEGGKVDISVAFTPSLITYSVKDIGIGIRANEQEMIFTKMFRGSNAGDDVKGSGLSLYIVKTLLSKVGGTIFFTSNENQGSTFTINLPATGMRKRKGTTRLDV
jgi:signal transduction histidine kinase